MAKKTNPLKFGKIELEKSQNTSKYVPQNGGTFVDHGDILKTLAIGIKDNLSVLLIGESGTGKTSAIRYLAEQTNNGLRRINLNGGTTADELIGRLLINEKGTYWVDGVLTEAMRNGEWIVLDEINAALPEVLFVLQSIMDDDGYLVLTEKDDKEIVRKHKDFRLFATCNPPEYAGTKEMNKALLSRFSICINADFPPEKVELDIVEHHLGNAIAQSDITTKLIGLATETRKAKELGTADYAINTRDILNTLRLTNFFEPLEALRLAFANKLERADNNALKLMAKLHLPSNKKKGEVTKPVPIQSENDIKISSTYTFHKDRIKTYIGLTQKDELVDTYFKNDLGSILSSSVGASKEKALAGDEFIVQGIYFGGSTVGASKTEIDKEDKLASIIEVTKGPFTGKKGIILHHRELDTEDVIEHLSELA